MKKIVKILPLLCLILAIGVLTLTACTLGVVPSDTQQGDKDHTHTVVADDAVAPTCTESGLTAGKHCSVCKEVIEKQETVEALGHTEVVDAAVEATCTAAGLTEGKHCSVCEEVLVKQETVTVEHTVVIDPAVEATCIAKGLTEGKHCSVCNTVIVKQQTVTASHTIEVKEAVAATCTESGLTSGMACSVCDKVFAPQSPIAALGHDIVKIDAVEVTCTKDGRTAGEYCSRCDEVFEVSEVLTAPGHTMVVQDAVAVTCTADGLTEGRYCSSCNEVFATQTVIPTTGHSTVIDKAVEATCTEAGLTGGSHCSACDEVFTAQQTVDALGHNEVVTPAVEASCKSEGLSEGSHCSRCGKVFSVQQVVAEKLPHTEVADPATEPTCTKNGRTEGSHCSVCNTVIVKPQTIPSTGHKITIDQAVAPTCTGTGLTRGQHCSVCGHVVVAQNEIAALGHTEVVDAAVAPTCTVNGFTEGKHCSVCSEVLVAQQSVAAPGHNYTLQLAVSSANVYAPICTVCGYYKPMESITYAEYGAAGNGTTDDAEAIRKAHNAANYYGLPVYGSADATYYIGVLSSTIVIKTQTDWMGASFIFDDSQIMWNDSAKRSVNIFTITHDDTYLYYDKTVPAALQNTDPNKYVLTKGQTKIEGLNLTGPAMILIENSNQRIFKRYGVNADSGDAMQEMLYVDKDGNIIGTPVQYDYSTITKIRAYSVTDETIEVGNAKIITIVPDPKAQDPDYENNYCFFNRGIVVRRSNTVLHDIEHIIEGEDMSVIIDRDGDGKTGDADPDGDGLPEKWTDDKSYGVPYSGFFGFEYSYNVQFKDCNVQGHQAYNFYQGTTASSRNEMGSYDIYAKYCVGLEMLNIKQRENYGDYTADTVITNRFMYHGVMGSYYCRNTVADNCYIDRFDSHKGMHSATITNSTLGFGILVIGGGDLYIENVYRVSEGPFILLREDYNSVFDGDVTIKNCKMGSSITSIIQGRYYTDHYCGLPNYILRSLTIDGLESENTGTGWITKTTTIYLFNISTTTTNKGESNPLYVPTSVRVRGVTSKASKTNVSASKNSDAFKNLTIVTGW